MVNKMKNKNIFLGVIIILLIVLGTYLIYSLSFKNTDKESNLVNLSVSELEAKINNKDTFIIVITQTGCSHCEQYIPELNRTLKENNLTAYKLNITELNKEDSSILSRYINFSGTPTTIFFHDGFESTTLNRIVGYASQAKITERLKSLGYID